MASRERLQSGLGELDYLRQRQEVLVRTALEIQKEEEEKKEEEEEVLLLRNQLRGVAVPSSDAPPLWTSDAGLIRLLSLDRQIGDLRLDSEASHDQLETDSRPSSGFYESSDGVSFSNSSNSVFSECFCSEADGRLLSADEPISCLDGGLCGDPAFVKGLKPEPSASGSAPLVSQCSSSTSLSPSCKRLDSYICSLLQRRAPPFRTSRPRTSVSADPAKSILRQASLCVRSGPGHGAPRAFEFKPTGPTGGASAGGAAPSSQRRWTEDRRSEETQKLCTDHSVDSMLNIFRRNSKDSAPNQSISPPSDGLQRCSSATNQDLDASSTALPPPSADLRELGSPKAKSSPKETEQPCCPPAELLLKSPTIKTAAKNSPKPPHTVPLQEASRGSSFQSPDRGGGGGGGSHMVNAKAIPAQRHTFKLRKGSKIVKTIKMKTGTTMRTSWGSEHKNKRPSERRRDASPHRAGSNTSRQLDDGRSVNGKVWKRAGKSHGASALDKQTTAKSSVQSGASWHHHRRHHHHGHHRGRDQVVVVAKPKHKQNGYRQLRAIAEVPNNEAFRCAQRKEPLIPPAAGARGPAPQQVSGPYSRVAGSDSEYSAECASLFHSTVADSGEDERSNCTVNRFGDNESGEEESSTCDTEESGGGRGRSQEGQKMTPAKAFVKIKASHHLKKKILRFRSGSLKLMTTV
ncbi:dapper homolog 1 [Clinocottus analis]|uniref:dapper homolog 1 n=1 Tax=Clinocottus analis TaxID=304258 RepID=UPI0035BFC131